MEKEYFAFISYQRKDEEWADWLRSKLEHYSLHSSVRKQDASLPKEIRPIFSDALELVGGVLTKKISHALSKFKNFMSCALHVLQYSLTNTTDVFYNCFSRTSQIQLITNNL